MAVQGIADAENPLRGIIRRGPGSVKRRRPLPLGAGLRYDTVASSPLRKSGTGLIFADIARFSRESLAENLDLIPSRQSTGC